MCSKTLRSNLAHVYWLGGSPCSGKSTIVDLIGDQYDIDVYHVDDAVRFNFGPYDADDQPCMYRWTTLLGSGEVTWDNVWMRPVDALLAEVMQCYTEQFDLMIAELLAIPPDRPLLVEGNPLLPNSVMPLLGENTHALWLVASEAFQRREYPRRGPWVQEILGQCSDPDRALRNWMDRDVAFAATVNEQAHEFNGNVVTVDEKRSIEENLRLVVDHFGLARIEEGPTNE